MELIDLCPTKTAGGLTVKQQDLVSWAEVHRSERYRGSPAKIMGHFNGSMKAKNGASVMFL